MATCDRCQKNIPDDAPAQVCPRCLLAATLEEAPAPEVPRHVGDHELVEALARGGMGVVYRARSTSPSREVALKMVVAGAHASELELRRFRAEAEAAAALDHPHIVPVYEVGEHDGLPFFTMRLMEGGSLAARASSFRDPRAAAALVATLARAIDYGHQRGVIHRDLKPANILFDADGRPAIADFGVAKRLGVASGTQTGAAVGTPGYMAPEQRTGRGPPTTAVDVFGLGAVLYELLTGRPPLSSDQATPDEEPLSPRVHAPQLPPDLEAVCLKCLELEPARRYASALQLAEDLERWLADEPVWARPPSRWRRLTRLARHHVPETVLLAFVLVAGVALVVTGLGVERGQADQLRSDAVRGNAYAAEGLASTVLLQFRDCAAAVDSVATDPRLASAFDDASPGDTLGELVAQHGALGFRSWLLLDAAGVVVGRKPEPAPEELKQALTTRDYVTAALARAGRGVRTPYVSKAFVSAYDGQRKVAFSAPVFDAGGRLRGVVAATLATDSAVERLRVPGDERRSAVLVAPFETGGFIALVHGALHTGDPLGIDSPKVAELARLADEEHQLELSPLAPPVVDEAWRDPATPEERWLAGFAPVGRTGYVVIVQTREEHAVASARTVTRDLAVGVAGPILGLVVLGLLVASLLKRARR